MNKQKHETSDPSKLKWFGCLARDNTVSVLLYNNEPECEEYKKEKGLKNITPCFEAVDNLEAYLLAHDYFFAPIMTLE